MSGGSYNYICCTLESECGGAMCDAELNELIKDLCDVLHDLEWWQSGDTSEDKYRDTVKKFKAKWLAGTGREERLKGYVDAQISVVRDELHKMIGI